jgi:SAM-dependent methyltransferase
MNPEQANDYREQIRARVLDEAAFVKATFSGEQRGSENRWERLVIRPVEVRGARHLQFSYFDAKKNYVYNHAGNALEAALEEALALPFRNFHVQTTHGALQIRLSKKGKPLISQHDAPATPTLTHDRIKPNRLPDDADALPFLRAVGIASPDGQIRADRRSKYRQITSFIELADAGEAFTPAAGRDSLRVLDAGCGSAYLTFALYDHLTRVKGITAEVTGIDWNAQLMAQNQQRADSLGADWAGHLRFETANIIDYRMTPPPDVVIALHACDTATDDALAQGIGWDCQAIVVAPCCQQNLQEKLNKAVTPREFLPVMRHGILRWEQGNLLTDAFRALLLRVMGYRTDVVEFVGASHTPKNVMIRAIKGAQPFEPKFVEEYRELKRFWGVTPHLESLLVAARPALARTLDADLD